MEPEKGLAISRSAAQTVPCVFPQLAHRLSGRNFCSSRPGAMRASGVEAGEQGTGRVQFRPYPSFRESARIMSPIPEELRLDRQARELHVKFDDGSQFVLPCEYLRIFSPSAEVKVARARGDLVTDKQDVNIERIEPYGTYAVRLYFSDGHDTGIYSWESLHQLGRDHQKNWQQYLMAMEHRDLSTTSGGERAITVLLFATLAERLGTERLDVVLPSETATVAELLYWLRQRGDIWREAIEPGRLTTTVNRQFAEPTTRLRHGDEVSLTPIYRKTSSEEF